MEKIVIDKSSCIGCGLCVANLPEYLVFDEMGHAESIGKELDPKDKNLALESVESCPVQAVLIEEEK